VLNTLTEVTSYSADLSNKALCGQYTPVWSPETA